MKRIISYDIVDDRRRSQVFKLLKDYGQWIQYSLFEISCNEARWIQLEHQLLSLLSENDSLCIYKLCQNCQSRTFYQGQVVIKQQEAKSVIL